MTPLRPLTITGDMIDFRSILRPGLTRSAFPASSKKRVLEQAAEVIAAGSSELTSRQLFDQLMARERLGSTGLGEGVALPHCRLDGTRSIMGAFLHLENAIDFDADDGEPVDLIFVLVVPTEAEGAHLEVLQSVARVFGDPTSRERLRALTDDADLYSNLLDLLQRAAPSEEQPKERPEQRPEQ